MVLFVVMMALLLGGFVLGYWVASGKLDDEQEGWLPPERRRWRPELNSRQQEKEQ